MPLRFDDLKIKGYNPRMTTENSESGNPFEKLSPVERQHELQRILSKLPHQLTKGEPQIVENLALFNELSALLKFSKGTPEFVTHQLREAVYSTEFGVESLRDRAERAVSEVEMFPGTLLVDVGVTGQFDIATVQIPEQRELLRLGRRRATQRVSQDHLLFVGWSASYENKYHQQPTEAIFSERDLPR